mmetsp:Transcript_3435/g.6444  ORF Transcript_3435/g.6444 Transcript_3435/m.6444 type:complete len:95 (+) Transcript_3435:3380-3664(+)
MLILTRGWSWFFKLGEQNSRLVDEAQRETVGLRHRTTTFWRPMLCVRLSEYWCLSLAWSEVQKPRLMEVRRRTGLPFDSWIVRTRGTSREISLW